MALANTEVDKIKSESCYQIGRCYHATNEFDLAYQYYSQAINFWAENVLAQFGLGKMFLYKSENDKAIKCFETVLSAHPDNYDTLKVLLH
jgi:RNA polymerase-associated protein CTR9